MNQLARHDADIDKLIHEFDMNRHIDQNASVEWIRGNNPCFVCGLLQWTRLHAERYAFGPELCIAERIALTHNFVDSGHQVSRLEAKIAHRQANHRERMFRLDESAKFALTRAERLEARCAELDEELRARGLDPDEPWL